MLQFILGNSGAGKSHYLYEKIIQESMKHPEINYLVIVPEQFTMQTQQDLCILHPNHGIMNIDVLSFGRMAHRIFEEVGQSRGQVLDDEGKNLILRKIAGQYEDHLMVLKGNLKKQGYISEVKSVISEFTQYGVGFEELDVLMENLDEESFLYYKLSDIRMIYEGFEQFLAEKYITKEELLDVLSQMLVRVYMFCFCGAQSDGGKVGDFEKQCDRTGWIYRIYTSAESASWRADEHLQRSFSNSRDGWKGGCVSVYASVSVVCTQ